MSLLLEKIFFAIFALSIVVFLDVLIKFKRPLILKYNFLLIVAGIGFAAYVHSLDLYSTQYAYYIILCKVFVSSAFLNVFSILYFPKFRKWVIGISFLLISFSIYSFYYNETYNPGYVSSLKAQTIVVVRSGSLKLPLLFMFLRVILITSFASTFINFLYKIINKFGMNNIYFDKIKLWTISIFIL